jgi:hypothetical protein
MRLLGVKQSFEVLKMAMVLFDFCGFAVLKLQMIGDFRYGSLRLHSGNINSLFLDQ